MHEFLHVKRGLIWAAIGAVAAGSYGYTVGGAPYFIVLGALLGMLVNGVLYKTVRVYRYEEEATCYAEQMRYPNGEGAYLTLGTAAYRLAGPEDLYDLGITPGQAAEKINSYFVR